MTADSAESGKLGVRDCIILLVGAMVGSAIFSLSGLTIFTAGPAAVLSWLLAGGIMLLYGLCMGKLAVRFPKSGGVYYFPRLAFTGAAGQWLGWCSCWSCILTNVAAIAFSGIYTGIYLAAAFPRAAGLQLPLALGSILFCLALNLLRIKAAGKISAVLVTAQILLMAVYIFRAFSSDAYDIGLLQPFFTQGTGGRAGFLGAIPVAIIGYSGIIAPAFLASEIRDVQTTLPRAMRMAMFFTAGLYALMILGTLGLVSAAALQAQPEMRFIPVFCACFTKLSGVQYLTEAVSIAAVLALLTTMNICLAINARAIQAAGEDGSLPAPLGRVTAGGVPAAGAILTAAAAMLYACFPGYTLQIVNFGAIFNIITMVLTMLALLKAGSQTGAAGRISGGKVLPLTVLVMLLSCYAAGSWHQGWKMWLYTCGFLLLGAAVKLLSGRRKP